MAILVRPRRCYPNPPCLRFVMELVETLNRTMKLALDDGSAGSAEEAEQIFLSFHIQIVLGRGVGNNRAQAALVTLLNAAPRTFLGEVTVVGQLDFDLDVGGHRGQSLRAAAALCGVQCSPLTLRITQHCCRTTRRRRHWLRFCPSPCVHGYRICSVTGRCRRYTSARVNCCRRCCAERVFSTPVLSTSLGWPALHPV